MKRNTLLFLIDALSALVLLGLIMTGLLLFCVLAGGSGRSMTLWGLRRHDWGDVHFWLAVAGVVLVLVHVMLHWGWVCATVRRLLGRSGPVTPRARRISGIASAVALVVLLVGFTLVAQQSVRQVESPANRGRTEAPYRGGQTRGDGSAADAIRGSMSLNEVAAMLGLPVETLQQRLGLPAGVDADRRLRDLMRQHGIPMSTVRDVAAAELASIEP